MQYSSGDFGLRGDAMMQRCPVTIDWLGDGHRPRPATFIIIVSEISPGNGAN